MNILKRTYIIFYRVILNFVYHLFSVIRKLDNEKVIIVLSRENKLQGNLQFVFFELEKQYPTKRIHFIQAENKMNFKLFKEIFQVSNAKYLILDDYFLPIYLIKPKDQLKVIQLWHAAGAFKKFGYSTIGTKFGPSEEYLKLVPIHANYTHVYVSSENIVPYYAEAFNMSEKNIYPLGIPRTDAFTDKRYKVQVMRNIASEKPEIINANKINILIAPTYRATGNQGESSLNMVDVMIAVSEKLNDDVQILYRAHPYTSEQELTILKQLPNVFLVDNFTLNDWMFIADAFITDYSSAIFDYCLLHRPFAHYVPDINEYISNRGFYESIDIISDGIKITNVESLIQWINLRKKDEYFNTTEMIRYNFSNIANVTEKIVRHFTEEKEEEDV